VKEETQPHFSAGDQGRIIIAQALYAFCALLCIFNTYWRIAFFVPVQLNYVIAPRIGRRASS
jgi:hypothetical protein